MTTLELWGSMLAFFMLLGFAAHSAGAVVQSKWFVITVAGMLVAWIGFVVTMVGRVWDAGG